MKKICALLILITMLFLSACGNTEKDDNKHKESKKENQIVLGAIDVLKEHWEEQYDEMTTDSDGYFEIKNTRVVNIKKNKTKEFKDVDYVVEFVLFTDYFGTAPYYMNVEQNDTVVVYKDGSMKMERDVINLYRSRYYTNDFSDFIKSVDDYGDQYNCVCDLN